LGLVTPATTVAIAVEIAKLPPAPSPASANRRGSPRHDPTFKVVHHDFFGAAAVLPVAKKAQIFAAERLKEAFEE
jgi:hypothetical protein